VGERIPRLTTLRYRPKLSIAMNGEKLRYFVHKQPDFQPAWSFLLPLVFDWLLFWGWFWLRTIPRMPKLLLRRWLWRK
jgi:hypothetical protein